MKQNQKGFTVVEVLLVILLIGLIIGGLFLVRRARDNLSHTVTDSKIATLNEINKDRKGKIEGGATAYTGQAECHQDDTDSPTKNKGPGIYVGVEHKFQQATDTTNKVTNESVTNGIFKTTKTSYPLVFDAQNSYMGVNRALIEFNFITTDEETAAVLTNTKAAITYKIEGQSYTTPEFTIESCVVKPLI